MEGPLNCGTLRYSNILLMITSNLIAAINTAIVEVEGVGIQTFTIINIITIRSGKLQYAQEGGPGSS